MQRETESQVVAKYNSRSCPCLRKVSPYMLFIVYISVASQSSLNPFLNITTPGNMAHLFSQPCSPPFDDNLSSLLKAFDNSISMSSIWFRIVGLLH